MTISPESGESTSDYYTHSETLRQEQDGDQDGIESGWDHNSPTYDTQLGSTMGRDFKDDQLYRAKKWDSRIGRLHERTKANVYREIEGLATNIGIDTGRNVKTGRQRQVIENAKKIYSGLEQKGRTGGRVTNVVAATCLYIGVLQAGYKRDFDQVVPKELATSAKRLYPKVVKELGLELPCGIPKTPKMAAPKKERKIPKSSGGRREGIFTATEVEHLKTSQKINEKSLSKIHTHLNKIMPAIQKDLWLLNSSKHLEPWRAKNRAVVDDIRQELERQRTSNLDQESFELPVRWEYRRRDTVFHVISDDHSKPPKIRNLTKRDKVYWLDESKPLDHSIKRMFDPEFGLGKINDPTEKARVIEMRKAHAIPIGRLNAISLEEMEYNIRKGQRPIEDPPNMIRGNKELVKAKIRVLEEELKLWKEHLQAQENS